MLLQVNGCGPRSRAHAARERGRKKVKGGKPAWRGVDPAVVALRTRLLARMSEAELEQRIEKEREAFGGLLDDEALHLLILDEMGLNEGAYVTIGDLKGRPDATVRVSVDRIDPPREFEREGRPPGRVVKCQVSDATGTARMVLWDKDVDKVEDGTLRPGARLTLVNARVKETSFGVELHVGPWTVLDVEGALDPATRKLLQDVAVQGETPGAQAAGSGAAQVTLPGTLSGTLAWLSPTRTYRKSEGGVGFACDADVDTPRGRVRLVAWDEMVKAVRALPLGAPIVAENVVQKVRGAATEWHTTRESAIRQA